jgi:predicted nucleic acid-binding protein
LAGKDRIKDKSLTQFMTGRNSTTVAALVDTNILVYRFDPRFPLKQERATELLRRGIEDESIVLPYQALVEFVAATTRPISGQASVQNPFRTSVHEPSSPYGH